MRQAEATLRAIQDWFARRNSGTSLSPEEEERRFIADAERYMRGEIDADEFDRREQKHFDKRRKGACDAGG